MGIGRRSFLHKAGQFLALLAAVDRGVRPHAAAAQAAELPRKLALLVGINRYPGSAPLYGSLADVDRQQELLVSRFGFQPQDIVILKDEEATRDRIEAVFVEHLANRVAPGDCVVAHFSGYGRQVSVDGESQECLLAAATGGRDLSQSDLPLSTLERLARSLPTSRVAIVLDTSFGGSEPALLGNLRSRTYPDRRVGSVSSAELAFRERLLARQPASAGDRDAAGPLLLRASRLGDAAVEGDWGGFQGGLFTCALTQSLWQAVPSRQLWFDLAAANRQVAIWTGGQQQLQAQLSSAGALTADLKQYGGEPAATTSTGRVAEIDRDGTVVVRLLGLPLAVLRGFATNSRLEVVDGATGNAGGAVLQIYAREGLVARTRLVAGEMPSIGRVALERVRVLPYNPGLTLALEASFDRIERVDATSAFANVAAVASPNGAGEGVADCVFGRSPNGGYSLQRPNGAVVPATLGPSNEAIKSAVGRLSEYFNTLLAAKLWRMLVNVGSSQLRASARLEASYPKARPLQWQATTGVTLAGMPDPQPPFALARVRAGDEIQLYLENRSDRPLYFVVLGLDAAGSAMALCPPFGNEPKIEPAGSRILPEPAASYDWIVSGPTGLIEIYIFLSVAPLPGTWEAIANTAADRGGGERIAYLSSPLAVTYALQEDLRAASAVSGELFGYDPAVFALDTSCWAAWDFCCQVEAT